MEQTFDDGRISVVRWSAHVPATRAFTYDSRFRCSNLELNPFITPLSTEPGVDNSVANKLKTAETDNAFNTGAFNANSMNLSPNITVYGLDDNGLDLKSYLHA